jgi:hypothetical protein
MKMPNLFVNAVATWDGKALTKGQKQIQGFEKGVKNLAKAFGVGLGAAAVVQFGKASVKAFSEDEVAANRLTTAVKNLGLGFEDERIKNFVSTIEAQTGVLDDKLRPALQSLLTTTGSVAKSQELLKLAIDVAAGSGEDLATVATDLSQAYVGNTKGLKKYYLGLTQAELKAASFNDIQTALNKQFSGSNAAYLDTYAGKMDMLGVSFANMQETIGKGLVDSFILLAGDNGIGSATNAMDEFATKTSDAIFGVATLLNKLNTQFGTFGDRSIGEILYASLGGGFIDALAKIGSQAKIKPKPFTTPMSVSGASDIDSQTAKKRAAADVAAAKRAKELAALQNKSAATAAKQLAAEKKRLLLEKAKAALTKAAATFDLTKISIAAALKATYDKDERLRLLAMQAIENDNGEAALEYIRQLGLLTAEQQTNKLAGIKTISETELNYINQLLLDELDRIKNTKMTEEEAALARQEAYAKYNAAIQQSGGLAEANFYSEKTQAELLAIAKLASLDKVAAAQATMNILNYTTQTDIIAKIAAAQKIADDAKYKALEDYLALLAKPLPAPGLQGGGDSGGGTKKPKFGVGGQPLYDQYGNYQYENYMPPIGSGNSGGSVDNSVTVVVEGTVINGDDFDEIVNQAMINAQRKGYSQYAAGSLP